MIKVSDYIVKYIKELGVKDIFMLVGGGCMHLVDSFGKEKDLNLIPMLHEQGATIAAEAYGQYTNHLGVTLVTTGPGATNAITGVAGAWIDSTPLLVISGQVKTDDMIEDSELRQKGVQEVDITLMVEHITKYAITIKDPKDIKYYLNVAIYEATCGRKGPVWLDVPLDIQGAMIDEDKLEGYDEDLSKYYNKNNIKFNLSLNIDIIIKLINKSKRPVILAGNGIRLAGALDKFKELVDYLKIPVLTTWKAIDFFDEEYEHYYGRPGSLGQRGANFIQQTCDLIIIIGARLDLLQVGYDYKNFAKKAQKVIIDIDATEVSKVSIYDRALYVDAELAIDKLLMKTRTINLKNISDWLIKCRTLKEKYPVVLPEYYKEDKYINTYVLVDILSKVLTKDDVIIPGSSGSCAEIMLQAFKVTEGQRIFNTPGLGSMGFGLPASIGACIASGRKRTICVVGDGGLQHNIQELEVISRMNLPIFIFVLNNNGYGSIRNMQNGKFDGNHVCCDPDSGMTLPNIGKVSNCYNIEYYKFSTHVSLEEYISIVLDDTLPCIVEVMVNPDLITAPRLQSEVMPDGSIVSKPIEDLWPYLDRDEFEENMKV